MANLLDTIRGYLTPELVSLLSSRLGESETSVTKGLNAALPLILGAMLQKTNDTGMMAQIMSLLTSRSNSADSFANLRGLASGDPSHSSLTDLGSNLLSNLFGSRLGSVTNALGEQTGLRSTSASMVMTMAASLITASLGDRVRREGLSSSGLASLLTGHRDGILRAIPGMLASVGGLDTVRNIGESTTRVVREADRRSSGLGWLPWAAIAALLLLLVGWAALRNRGTTEVEMARRADQVARQAADGAARQAGQAANQVGQAANSAVEQGQIAVANLGQFMTRKLPSAIELSIPERGVENQLVTYLDDRSKQLEPVVWFNFDRLLFETGSATLKPQSQEQLKNVAEILKAYPAVKMKIGGYTDNVGDPAFNLKLSQDRATNVVSSLVALGVAPERLSAEGYGEQYPVAENTTEAGRQQNRRIAMRITEK